MDVTTVDASTLPSIDAVPAPPPPPTGVPEPPAPPSGILSIIIHMSDTSAAPPPPPPPAAAEEGGESGNGPPAPPVPVDSGRQSLLADIRKGHKHRLKSAKQRKTPSKPTSKAKPEPTVLSKCTLDTYSNIKGDIFSHLIVALNRRRVGIAAKQEEKANEGNDRYE